MPKILVEMSKNLGARYSVQIGMTLEVFDQERVRAIPLISTGLASSGGEEPYRTWDGSSYQKYMVEGDIEILPHDRCPQCWGEWDFKFRNRECPECGVALGAEVKILLDTDVCPHCEEGRVSMTEPTCTKCGFEVEPDLVVWG